MAIWGRFHPLFTHLPIGMVLFAIVLEWRSRSNTRFQSALKPIWLLSALCALLAATSGYAQGRQGGYEADLVLWHQYSGIATTILCFLLCWPQNRKRFPLLLLLGLILGTTWLGTSLTHSSFWNAQTSENPKTTNEPAAADPMVIEHLKNNGVIVVPVAENSHFLSINCVNAAQIVDSNITVFEKLAQQIQWLKLGGARISDSALITIGKLDEITRLSLENLPISDKGLAHLKTLNKLEILNLKGTNVGLASLDLLKGFPNLRKLFIYQSNFNNTDYPTLLKSLGSNVVDTGAYKLPFMESDTARLKAKILPK